MYYTYMTEKRRRSGRNGFRAFGLPAWMAPCAAARHLFGFTQPSILVPCLMPFRRATQWSG